MTDKRKVYPKLGNAFAQQAYLDSLMQSSASAANTPTSDTFSLDMEERRRPEPLATRSRTQSLSPLKTAAQSKLISFLHFLCFALFCLDVCVV